MSRKGTNFKDLIYVADQQLTTPFCEHVIRKYEDDPRKLRGVTAGGVQLHAKQSQDLMITGMPEWNDEDSEFSDALSKGVRNYSAKMESYNCKMPFPMPDLQDIGYQIQRTTPHGFYDWHSDLADTRLLTFLFYLNDVKKKGYTEFIDGTRVQPRTGRLLIFPSQAQYVHRGVAPVNQVKYIMTGWLYTPFSGDPRIPGSWKEASPDGLGEIPKSFEQGNMVIDTNSPPNEEGNATMIMHGPDPDE